ncbi:MAG: type VI secretion system baseplate subunit TssF [Rhodospirillales bacterium]|nr:type VI secretion system baseplate subunit TssF [Rhodospirillales bacterium]
MTSEAAEEHRRYYLGELEYLRTAGAEFAQQYPQVAGRLDLGDEGSSDPQIERLIESFAFLAARLQRNIDRQFPDIAAALLDVLYPQLTAPIPSMAIAEFVADPEQSRSLQGLSLPANLPMYATAEDGLVCRFRTCYPVTFWPVEVADADFVSPGAYAFLDDRSDVATVLRLRVACLGNRTFSEFAPPFLRFHLHGQLARTGPLYELLFNATSQLAILPEEAALVAPGERVTQRPTLVAADRIRPVGFASEEPVLPYPPHAHQGFRLLQEYFTFPEKFLFFDIERPAEGGALGTGARADLLFLFTEKPRQALMFDRTTFRLGCTPIVNLFRRIAEPIRLDETQLEYRLVPDVRFERSTEIHTILDVSASLTPERSSCAFRPYFSFTHADDQQAPLAYWSMRRQPTLRAGLHGSDTLISFLDLDFQPMSPASKVVFAHTLCTNRGIAEQMPAGTPLHIEVDAPVSTIRCLSKPTRQLIPPYAGETLWQLVSHLSLNHLSLAGGPESLAALREILSLYAGLGSTRVAEQIAGLTALSTRRVVRRIGADAWRGLCRGTEVTLEFDETRFVGASAFLLGAVLSRFFALYAAVNSFTQLVVTSRQRDGVWTEWPPFCGETAVL